MKKLTLSVVLLASLVLMMTACSKGSTGPAGADGATGATGPQGPAGPAGASDSIQYSTWTTLNMNGYVDANNDTSYEDTLVAPALTSAVLDKDVVVGYMLFVDNNNDTVIVNASTLLSETYGTGYIDLYSGAPYSSNSAGSNYSGYSYRYVVVPATISINSATGSQKVTYTRAQLQAMSYSKLTQLLQIPAKGSKLLKPL